MDVALQKSHTRFHNFSSVGVIHERPCFYDAAGGLRCRKPLAPLLHSSGASLPPSGGFRPANTTLLSQVKEQRIPRTIVQVGVSFAHAMATHASHMRTWWTLNPEYNYRFFGEADAHTWVEARASREEARAYGALLVDASRADLFRSLFLKYDGGVYADIDMEAGRPLREVITPHASAVVTYFWSFEFFAFEPGHPMIAQTARTVTTNVLQQLLATATLQATAALQAVRAPHARRAAGARGKHSEAVSCVDAAAARRRSLARTCIHDLTGPLSWLGAVHNATLEGGCSLRPGHLLIDFRDQICGQAQNDAIRRTLQCQPATRKENVEVPTWECAGAARHWDCRYCKNVACPRCSSTHWMKAALPRGGMVGGESAKLARLFFRT